MILCHFNNNEKNQKGSCIIKEVFFKMKKKIFAVALAATMVVGSTMSAFAEDVDTSAGFATAKSTDQVVGANFDATYTFDIQAYGSGANTYENAIIELFSADAQHYLTVVCNGGAWFWNATVDDASWLASDGTANNGELTCVNECTDTDMTLLKDAKMTVNVKKSGADVTIVGTVDGNTVWNFSVTGNDVFAAAECSIHVTGEKTVLKNVEFTKGDAAAPAETEAAPAETEAAPAETDAAPAETQAAAPQTGDATNVAIFALAAIAACGAVVATRKKVTE